MSKSPRDDLEHLAQLLDRHGPDPLRFPEAERERALSLLQANAEARRMLAQAAALPHALDSLDVPTPSAALRRAVAEIPLRNPHAALQSRASLAVDSFRLRNRWATLLAAAFVLLLGAVSGRFSAQQDESTAAQSEFGADLGELAELSFGTDIDQELAP
jgi:hypothetical protein